MEGTAGIGFGRDRGAGAGLRPGSTFHKQLRLRRRVFVLAKVAQPDSHKPVALLHTKMYSLAQLQGISVKCSQEVGVELSV